MKPYQFRDERTHSEKTYYLLPCESCKEVIIEYENGRIYNLKHQNQERGCPFLKLETETEKIISDKYGIYSRVSSVREKVKYECALYNLKREISLMLKEKYS